MYNVYIIYIILNIIIFYNKKFILHKLFQKIILFIVIYNTHIL